MCYLRHHTDQLARVDWEISKPEDRAGLLFPKLHLKQTQAEPLRLSPLRIYLERNALLR